MSPYTRGLHELGSGCWAWLQPDGSWGWSNAGLLVDGEASLLVDTLFDLRLTREMLDAMRDAVPAARRIGTLVNTHANGDHCYGNSLVPEARVITSKACAEEMAEGIAPSMMAGMIANADEFGAAGEFFRRIFGPFDFEGIEVPPPDETFTGELELRLGDRPVHLIEVGPAHTRGDVLIWSPHDRAVFTGDILFIGGTPIIWEGPVHNWIAACERIEALGAEHVVPGHGPVTDAAGAAQVREYLAWLRDESRARWEGGMSAEQAARDIALGEYRHWLDSERIVINVDTLYREFSGSSEPANITELFARMARIASD